MTRNGSRVVTEIVARTLRVLDHRHFAKGWFRIWLYVLMSGANVVVPPLCPLRPAEEFESHQDRSGQPDVLMGQSIVLSEIKAEVSLENDIPSHQNLLLQRYEERIKLLSQENKVSKFCMDAGFLHVV